mgnify:CR=1 FL=1
MHTLVLTCAGSSKRFKGYGPKWTLTHPSGNLMACESVRGLSGYDNFYFVMTYEQSKEFPIKDILIEFDHAGIMRPEVLCIEPTANQVETVKSFLNKIDLIYPFTVKDCDNYFKHELKSFPSVAVNKLSNGVVAENKSYVDKLGAVDKIVEKKVISDYFCVGAYTFSSSEMFFKGITGGEEYISQVIDNLCSTYIFESLDVENYIDWGTSKEWKEFLNSYSTIFCDIDGVLVENSHRTFGSGWGAMPQIVKNVNYINELFESGKHHIILTTSRNEKFRNKTEKQLKGVHHHRLIMELPACQRLLINDFVSKRSKRTAHAINIERNGNNLQELIEGELYG